MHIVLTAADFGRLSARTRADILALLGPVADEESKGSHSFTDGDDQPEALTLGQVKQIASGVNERANQALRVIADRDGRVTYSELKERLSINQDIEWQGIQSGLHRRLRTVIGDKDRTAILLSWDEHGEDWVVRISKNTCKALQQYFANN
jgi:hypothetical protein